MLRNVLLAQECRYHTRLFLAAALPTHGRTQQVG